MSMKDQYDDYETRMTKKVLLAFAGLVIFAVGIALLFGSWFVVGAGERGIVFSNFNGLHNTIYDEGMHFKLPLFEQAVKMNIRVQKQEENATGASKDLQDAKTTVAVNYQVDPTTLVEMYRKIGASSNAGDYMQSEIMNPIIQESVKAVTAEYTADELITKRPLVKAEIDDHIKQRLAPYHIEVLDVSITNFQFSELFSAAIESKVTAEQNALKEENNLKVVKFQADQKIEQARGDAESIKIVNEQLTQSPTYIQYYLLQKWDGHMPQALGSNTIMSITTAPIQNDTRGTYYEK